MARLSSFGAAGGRGGFLSFKGVAVALHSQSGPSHGQPPTVIDVSAPALLRLTCSRNLRRKRVLGLIASLTLLTGAVAVGAWPVGLDRRVAASLAHVTAGGHAGWLLTLASLITTLGTPAASVLMTLALAAWLAHRARHLNPLRKVGAPLTLLVVSVLAGKARLERPGPPGSAVTDGWATTPQGTPRQRWCAAVYSSGSATPAPHGPPWRRQPRLGCGPSWSAQRWSSTATTGPATSSPGCCLGSSS